MNRFWPDSPHSSRLYPGNTALTAVNRRRVSRLRRLVNGIGLFLAVCIAVCIVLYEALKETLRRKPESSPADAPMSEPYTAAPRIERPMRTGMVITIDKRGHMTQNARGVIREFRR